MPPRKFSNVIRTSICGLVVATVGQFLVFAEREPPIRTGLWVIQSLAEDSNKLSFNVTRARPKKRDLAQSTLDLIIEKNSFDISLYECAAKLFEDAVNKNAAEVNRIARELEAARARTQDPLSSALFSIRAAGRKAISRAYSTI